MPLSVYAAVFRSRTILLLMLLGFSSGLPLALTAGTLQAWLAVEGVDIVTIGWFALVGQPYTYKFLWAPLMDRYAPPFLGRRRGWLAATQLVLLALIALLGSLSPKDSPWLTGMAALAVAFVSASQDIVADAYRSDILRAEERGAGAAVSVLGYRLAMLVSGAGALVVADQWLGWHGTYWLMAGLMVVGMAATWFALEPAGAAAAPKTLNAAVTQPMAEFFSRHGAVWILLLVVLYKLGDAFAGNLTTAFLLRGPGFSATEVGAINKGFGLVATILGALAGGAMMARLGLFRALLLFGMLQAITNLGFMLLAASGKDYVLMAAVIGAENLCGGMGTAAYVALLMALCDRRFSATQYALLSALSAVGRVYVGPAAGYMVSALGWTAFFLATFVIALPGILMLYAMRGTLEALDAPGRK
ncbi:MAG: muropeptide transporter AmpG [Betaproteobacteria bacterium RIFCSPLOWO2_02_67_12]|nr:MAG: muropeptide transporter AmpG [Betaproteobacteria bacterium RIFCSPLOWO2_02_67_12]OGA26647.1 MAG: muropeptide transporter AmpG [Betaproteobacteria bacterium RIFCSPLOWO2_02_FULL_68_150]OGA57200.1 MAG: muropeptide transporter AmpG [Betaproteobacteria bacterium RIFCSPLOWO2_12_FULL_67_28]